LRDPPRVPVPRRVSQSMDPPYKSLLLSDRPDGILAAVDCADGLHLHTVPVRNTAKQRFTA